MESIDESVQDRFRAVKDSVRKATEQAMKDASVESAMELRTLAEENDDPNSSESFALGMTLFGKDVSSVEREFRDRLGRIETELKEVVLAVESQQGEIIDNDEEETSNDPESLQEEANMLTCRFQFLRECSAARSFLDEASMVSSAAMPNDPDFVESARLLAKAQAALEKAQEVVREEEARSTEPTPALMGAYHILNAIRDPLRRKRVELITKATSLLESSITVTSESITIRGGRMTPGQSKGLHAAYDILEALSPDDNERLEVVLRRLTDRLFQVVIQPQLDALKSDVSSVSTWKFNELSDGTKGLTGRVALTKTRTYTLEWSLDDTAAKTTATSGSPQEISIKAWNETFKFVQRILYFVEERMLLKRAPLCQFVGQRLFGTQSNAPTTGLNLQAFGLESSLLADDKGLFVKPAIDLMWETCIPSQLESDKLASLGSLAKTLQECTDSFEEKMRQQHYLPTSGYHPLSDFALNFESKYVEKRRCTLLNEARDILLHSDYHNTIQVGVDVKPPSDNVLDEDDGMSVFKLHKSCVSQTSSHVMSLCRATMDEAVSVDVQDPASPLALLPATLYRTAREMLDLFRAIIPATHGGEVATIPRTAAVLHNDCVFLAHHCLTLGLEYKDKFPLAPGTEDDRGQLLRQTCMFVDMVPSFRELADRSMGDMLERQKGQLWEIVGNRIKLLSESLRSNESLVEWGEAETALKAGLYHLSHLAQNWKPILSQQVFGRSMAYLCEVLFAMFTDQVMKATAISEPACQFVGALFRTAMTGVTGVLDQDTNLCRTWDRFSAIGSFMDMSLSDIQAALSEGVFRSVTGPELSRLIVATFDESPKRDHLLQVLASHN